jgi:hypothetical protein
VEETIIGHRQHTSPPEMALLAPAAKGSHHRPSNRSRNTARLSRFPGTA